MFEHIDDDIYDSDSSYLGTSPPRRPVIAESSDLFRAVMEECFQDDRRLSKAVIDSSVKRSPNRGSADLQRSSSDRCQKCHKCFTKSVVCRCSGSRTGNRNDSARAMDDSQSRCVHWVDELLDKPLAIEADLDSLDFPAGLPSFRDSNIKPILKHRANCVIIISE